MVLPQFYTAALCRTRECHLTDTVNATFLHGAPRLADVGKLDELIKRDFESLEGLQKQLNAAATAIQGSGWAWLVSRGCIPYAMSADATACF